MRRPGHVAPLLVLIGAAVLASALWATPPVRAALADGSRLHWVANGAVTAGAVLGDTLYVGGTFTRVSPFSSALGALHSVAAADGGLEPGLPMVDGEIRDIELDGEGGYFIGGSFSSVAGVPRGGLAHVRADGALDPTFAPVIAAQTDFDRVTIRSVLAHHGVVYFVGAGLSLLNGSAQSYNVAAVDAGTGSTRSFPAGTPYLASISQVLEVNGQVTTVGERVTVFADDGTVTRSWPLPAGEVLTAVAAGGRLLVGGRFYTSGSSVRSVLTVDPGTGAIDEAWPQPVASNGEVRTLAVSGPLVYVGGQFTRFQGQVRDNLAAIDLATGVATAWAPSADGPVDALTTTSDRVLVGGNFLTVNGAVRERLAAIDSAGLTSSWQSSTFPTAVRALVRTGGTLVVGGRMAIAGGSARSNYAAFDLGADVLLPWAPDTPSHDAVAMAAAGTRVFIGTEDNFTGQPDVTTVSADTGATLPAPWMPPARLAGVAGGYVYVSAGQDVERGIVRRAAVESGIVDPSWAVDLLPIGIVDGVIYGAATTLPWRVVAFDLNSGAPAPWTVPLSGALHTPRVGEIAVDGSTGYVTYADNPQAFGAAFDVRSGIALPWSAVDGVRYPSIAAADGRLLLHARNDRPGSAITAFSVGGPRDTWDLPMRNIPAPIRDTRTIFTTATDLIVLGTERASPLVHGIAVLPRTSATNPHALTWTSSGRDVTLFWKTAQAAASYILHVGSQPGLTDLGSVNLGPVTSITAPAATGTYFVTVRAAGSDPPSNTVAVVAGCQAPPPAPTALSATVAGRTLTLQWTPPPFGPISGYLLEAGHSAGLTDIGTLTVGPVPMFAGAVLAPGEYVVRARALNACGRSAPTAEVAFTIGVGLAPPGDLTASVNGHAVTLRWQQVAGASAYRLEAGSAPSLANLGALTTGATTVVVPNAPPGIYFVRVRALSSAGVGPPSSEVTVAVPGTTATEP